MRIGLLSDIHGDIDGLKLALSLLNEQGIETILCAGDLVNGSGRGDEVIDLIRARSIPCVVGNHDQDAPTNVEIIRAEEDITDPRFQRWLLNDESLAYLKALPRTRSLTLHDKSILLTHGTPDEAMAYLFPDSDIAVYREIVQTYQSNVVIMGHTHIPMHIRVGTCHFINPGSVYRNRFNYQGTQTCGIFNLDTMRLMVFDIQTNTPSTYEQAEHDS